MRRFLTVFFVCALITFAVQAEQATVDVTVTVVDGSSEQPAGIEGAYVKLGGTNLGDSTDESGVVRLSGVPFGEYLVSVEADGFENHKAGISVTAENNEFQIRLIPEE